MLGSFTHKQYIIHLLVLEHKWGVSLKNYTIVKRLINFNFNQATKKKSSLNYVYKVKGFNAIVTTPCNG